MARLDGKIAIITGAAKGLGEADARIFAREGATVILTDVDEENGTRVAQEIGEKAEFHVQDVTSEEGWINLIDDVVARHGRLDVLVNNAGVVAPGTIETQTADEYRFVMGVSADASFFGCKHAVKAMKETGGGSIINMCSIASLQGEPYVAAYCAAKGAVESLTRAVAVHSANNKLNVRCNSVHPSGILTPMVMNIGVQMEEIGLSGQQGNNAEPSKLGEPDDIANTVLFLASDESKFINGAAIRVDNAMSAISGVVPE